MIWRKSGPGARSDPRDQPEISFTGFKDMQSFLSSFEERFPVWKLCPQGKVNHLHFMVSFFPTKQIKVLVLGAITRRNRLSP